METGPNMGCEERFCAVIVLNQVKFDRPNLDQSALRSTRLGLDASMCRRAMWTNRSLRLPQVIHCLTELFAHTFIIG